MHPTTPQDPAASRVRRWASARRATLYASLLLAGSAVAPPLSGQEPLPDAQLFDRGAAAYERQDYVSAAAYLFAYLQRAPEPLRVNAPFAASVRAAYAYSRDQLLADVALANRVRSDPPPGVSTKGLHVPPPPLERPPQPAGGAQVAYPIVCRGGGALYFSYQPFSNFSPSAQIWITFQRGAQKVGANWENVGTLLPGQCSWLDRTVGDGEPSRIIVTGVRDFSIAWTENQVMGISAAVPYVNRLREATGYQSFDVYNDGRGNLVVSRIGSGSSRVGVSSRAGSEVARRRH